MAGVCIRTGDARGRGENAIFEAQTARWKLHGFFVFSRHEASSPPVCRTCDGRGENVILRENVILSTLYTFGVTGRGLAKVHEKSTKAGHSEAS